MARSKTVSQSTIGGSLQDGGTMTLPDANGYFGKYGGRFVPETLMEALLELESDYQQISNSSSFQEELRRHLQEFAGRPTPLYFARRLTEKLSIGKETEETE